MDTSMTYYVQVLKNNRSIGRVRHGRVDCYGTLYPHPSAAKLAARRLLKKFPLETLECQIRRLKDHVLNDVVWSPVTQTDGLTALEHALYKLGEALTQGNKVAIGRWRPEVELQAKLFYGRRR